MPADSLTGTVIRKNGKWFVNAKSLSNSWDFKSKYADNNVWDADISFDKCPLNNISGWLNDGHVLSGTLTGTANYSSTKDGNIKLSATGLAYDNQPIGDTKLSISLTKEAIKVDSITVYLKEGKAIIWGQVGLSKTVSDTNLNFDIHQLPAGSLLIDGKLILTGKTRSDGFTDFSGNIKSDNFSINKWSTKEIYASIKLYGDTLSINDFICAPYFKGDLNLTFPQKTLKGKFLLQDIPLKKINPLMSGIAKGVLNIKGNILFPELELKYSASGTVFNDVSFDHAGDLKYFNGLLNINNIRLSCGKSFADVSGVIFPKISLKAAFSNVTGDIIKQISNMKSAFGGTFSGEMEVKGSVSRPEISIGAVGNNVSYGDIHLSELKGHAFYSNNIIKLNALDAKYSDSELKLLPASSIDLKKSQFVIKTECRNVHVGPFDVFGGINATGKYDISSKGKIGVLADIFAKNVWINQYNLTDFKTELKLKDGVVEFQPKDKSELKLIGRVDLNQMPQISVHHLRINYENIKELAIEGEIGNDKWDFTVSGKNIEVSAASELAGLTFPCDGSMDINITGKGSLEKPQLEASIDLYKGQISSIPYDNIYFLLSAKKDVITILKSRVTSKGKYSILASGYFAFLRHTRRL